MAINFLTINRKNGMVVMDGYTTCKYRKNALKDIAKAVADININEGQCILDQLNNGEDPEVKNTDIWSYCLELEEVGCASRYNEDTDDMEYADGKWYFLIRFEDNAKQEEKDMENNEIKKMTRAQLDDAQTREIYSYTYTVWGHDTDDINSTWEGAITVNQMLKASVILGLYMAKYPDHGVATDCGLYEIKYMAIDYDMTDKDFCFIECDRATTSDTREKWESTMHDTVDIPKIDGKPTITVEEIDRRIVDAIEPWTQGEMGATEAIIAVESTIDRILRDYTHTGYSFEINQIVASHESNITSSVRAGVDRLIMPLKNIRLLAKHGIDMKVDCDKVYACDGYEWEDVTDMSSGDLYSWLGY